LLCDSDNSLRSPGPDQTEEDKAQTAAKPTDQLCKAAEESRTLYREALAMSANSRDVDLSIVTWISFLPASVTTGPAQPNRTKVQQFKKRLQKVQVANRKEEINKLRRIEAPFATQMWAYRSEQQCHHH
jgi:hypothetical protein